MTEAEWMACADLGKMVYFLGDRIRERKWCLFAVACAHSIEPQLHDQRSRDAIEVMERLADEDSCRADVEFAHRMACASLTDSGADRKRYPPEDVARVIAIPTLDPKSVAHATAMSVVSVVGEMAWKEAMGHGRSYQEKRRKAAWREQESIQVALLRDVIGNPFRPLPSIDPAWLAWNDGTIAQLAQPIYDLRAFDRLPILADALEDAGCHHPEILAHCRGPGPHARGCWLIDLLLGKE